MCPALRSEPITVDRGREVSAPRNVCRPECTANREKELGWLMKGRKSRARQKQQPCLGLGARRMAAALMVRRKIRRKGSAVIVVVTVTVLGKIYSFTASAALHIPISPHLTLKGRWNRCCYQPHFVDEGQVWRE